MNANIDASILLVAVVVVAALVMGLLRASAIDDLRKRTRRLGG
jgi:hypothetical protein